MLVSVIKCLKLLELLIAWFFRKRYLVNDIWRLAICLDTTERKAIFLTRFHPGVWKRPGRYSCCDDINRRSLGCQLSEHGGGMLTTSNELIRRASFTPQSPPESAHQAPPPVSPVITSMSTVSMQTVTSATVPAPTTIQGQQQLNLAMPIPKMVTSNNANPGQPIMLSAVQQQLLQHQQQAILQQQQKLAMFNAQGLQQPFVNVSGSVRVRHGSSGRFQNTQQQPSIDFVSQFQCNL